MDTNKIVEAMRSVKDPDSGNDLVQMGKIKDLKVNDQGISFTVSIPNLAETAKFQLHENLVTAIQGIYPAAPIDIHFARAQENTRTLGQVKNIIAVASGKGGVGKSTVSTNLALGLHKLGGRVGLMDADLYGPSIPTMLGIQKEKPVIKQLYGRHRILPIEKYGIHTISIGNIVDADQAVVLRGPRLGGIIKQFINEVIWPELDYLIIDLPPGTGDIQLTLVQSVPLTGAIMVTTPQQVAVADAIKAMNMFRLENIRVPIVGVVENMSWFIPEDRPDKKYEIFGTGGGKSLAKLANTVLLGQLPLVTSIREGGDRGIPAILSDDEALSQAYLKLSQKTVQQVNVRNEVLPPTQIVGVNLQK